MSFDDEDDSSSSPLGGGATSFDVKTKTEIRQSFNPCFHQSKLISWTNKIEKKRETKCYLLAYGMILRSELNQFHKYTSHYLYVSLLEL